MQLPLNLGEVDMIMASVRLEIVYNMQTLLLLLVILLSSSVLPQHLSLSLQKLSVELCSHRNKYYFLLFIIIII
jgi:hypothetical protein